MDTVDEDAEEDVPTNVSKIKLHNLQFPGGGARQFLIDCLSLTLEITQVCTLGLPLDEK